VFGLEYGGKGLWYFKGVQKYKDVENIKYYKLLTNSIQGNVQHVMLL